MRRRDPIRIGDALMENTRQDTLKVFAQEMQILKGQFGFVQLPFRKNSNNFYFLILSDSI